MRILLLTFLCASVLALPAVAQTDKPADVAGAWALEIETPNGKGAPSLTLKQDGEKLTGTYSSQVIGDHPVTGTIKGNAITFGFEAAFEGNKLVVTYTGTVDKDTMKGKADFGGAFEGPFTGKKK